MTRRRAVLVLALVTAAGGCTSTTPAITDPKSSSAGHVNGLWWLMFWLAAGVYVIVVSLVVVAALRRHNTADHAVAADDVQTDFDQRRDHHFLLYGGLAAPLLIIGVVAVQTVRVSNALQAATPAAVHIQLDGEQWWWRATYPDDGVATANEIHVPVGEPVEITLRSDNVIHSFWVPQLNGKTDLIPGRTNVFRFTADHVGEFRGQCAEFCGIQHAHMAFVVVAQPPAEYQQWLAANRAPAVQPQTAQQRVGQQYLTNLACAGCHTVSGTSANSTFGPDLSHVGARRAIAAETLPNTPENMRRWLDETQEVKHGALMPEIDLTPEQLDGLVSYLESLK